MLTAALRENGAATVLGADADRTFGKGVIQTVQPLGDPPGAGGGVAVTVATFFRRADLDGSRRRRGRDVDISSRRRRGRDANIQRRRLRYSTPSGANINGKGIIPDRKVACGVADKAAVCAGR